MDDSVNDLVTSPFKELVEKASEALRNAEDGDAGSTEPMQKAAKNLIKEGERALKKIEPLCEKYFHENGVAFVDALKANDEIAQLRTELNDALWEFDDYVTVDEFDADKFSELQALSRKAAPKILEAIRRLRLEASRAEFSLPSPSLASAALSTPRTEEAPSPLPETPSGEPVAVAPPDAVGDGAEDVIIMGTQAGPDLGLDEAISRPLSVEKAVEPAGESQTEPTNSAAPSRTASRSYQQPPQPAVVETGPPEPPLNPWHLSRQAAASPDTVQGKEPRQAERRRVVSQDGSATSPLLSSAQEEPPRRARRLDIGVDRMLQEAEEAAQQMTISGAGSSNDAGKSENHSQVSGPAPPYPTDEESDTVHALRPAFSRIESESTVRESTWQPANKDATGQAISADEERHLFPESPGLGQQQRWSRASSAAGSYQHSLFSGRQRDSLVSPVTADNRMSMLSFSTISPVSTAATHDMFTTVSKEDADPRMSASFGPQRPMSELHLDQPNPPRSPTIHPTMNPDEQPGLELVVAPVQKEMMSSGLIPVEEDRRLSIMPEAPLTVSRQPDCTITNQSSFHQLGRICDGAAETIRGGLGIKKVKKPGYYGAGIIAKCKSCLYELEWKQVEADLNNEESGNFRTNGVGFRLRVLSKFHMAAKTVDEQQYACLFCIQAGRTVEESDATVFFSQKQLFSHLARHPRPLPTITGLTVIDGPEIPPQFRNNYDLHFQTDPLPSLMAPMARQLATLPTATAIQTMRPVHGAIRAAPDKHRPLQFAVGAKIVGVEFAPQYGGEWAIGWSDQLEGAFPADCIKLDPPPANDIRMHGNSTFKAVARWKFHHKDKDRGDWLKFDKGDVITNISWSYAEHWCWSGTNPKGKWGIFPRSHIDPISLQETTLSSDRVSVLSRESKSSNLLSRVSLRHHRSTSKNSDGSGTPTSPRPLIY